MSKSGKRNTVTADESSMGHTASEKKHGLRFVDCERSSRTPNGGRNLEGDPSDGEWLPSPAAAPIILASSGVESSRSRCARLAWGAVTQLHKVRIFPSQLTLRPRYATLLKSSVALPNLFIRFIPC